MFKMRLLTSTAMTAVALLLSGAPDAAQAQTGMHVADPDTNSRFLCTYGQFTVSFYSNIQSSERWWTSTRVAAPFIGHGQTVSRIIVMETQNSWTRGRSFSAGIHSNTASGLPGKLIAGGTGKAPTACRKVTIPIAPTTLKANTKYWIEEKGGPSKHGSTTFLFLSLAVNPKDKHKAYVQTHRRHVSSSSSSSSTSPWTKQPSGPWFQLK